MERAHLAPAACAEHDLVSLPLASPSSQPHFPHMPTFTHTHKGSPNSHDNHGGDAKSPILKMKELKLREVA